MKTLLLSRHAKSSWQGDLDDFDRPLNDRGLRDSLNMGERVFVRQRVPQVIVSSPAKRAISTAQRLAKTMQLTDAMIVEEPIIYEASSDALYNLIWAMEEGFDQVMVVGHNPGISSLAQSLVTVSVEPFVTCEIVCIVFQCNTWDEIIPKSGQIAWRDYPKNTQS